MWVSGRATYKQNNHEHWQANSNDSQLNSSNHRRQAQLNNSWKSICGYAWSTQTTSESWELLLVEKIPTPVDMVNIPLFTRFEKIPSGAGFLPSTVSTTNCVSIAATALKQSTIVLLNKNMTRKRCFLWHKSTTNFNLEPNSPPLEPSLEACESLPDRRGCSQEHKVHLHLGKALQAKNMASKQLISCKFIRNNQDVVAIICGGTFSRCTCLEHVWTTDQCQISKTTSSSNLLPLPPPKKKNKWVANHQTWGFT